MWFAPLGLHGFSLLLIFSTVSESQITIMSAPVFICSQTFKWAFKYHNCKLMIIILHLCYNHFHLTQLHSGWLCYVMETIVLSSFPEPEEKNVIFNPYAHTQTRTSPLTSQKVEVSTQCCISHGWLVMSNALNSDITQHQMFIIEKQKAFKSVGRRFPLCDNDSRDIKICWLFLMPGFNTGLCQCSSPKTLCRDSEQKWREKNERKKEGKRSSGFTAAGPAQP